MALTEKTFGIDRSMPIVPQFVGDKWHRPVNAKCPSVCLGQMALSSQCQMSLHIVRGTPLFILNQPSGPIRGWHLMLQTNEKPLFQRHTGHEINFGGQMALTSQCQMSPHRGPASPVWRGQMALTGQCQMSLSVMGTNGIDQSMPIVPHWCPASPWWRDKWH